MIFRTNNRICALKSQQRSANVAEFHYAAELLRRGDGDAIAGCLLRYVGGAADGNIGLGRGGRAAEYGKKQGNNTQQMSAHKPPKQITSLLMDNWIGRGRARVGNF